MAEAEQKLDIEKRVEIQLAIGNYLRAIERFEKASHDFNESCQRVRECVPRSRRFIVNHNHQMHMITTDTDGSFQVEQIETI
jgi:hypothetical protein